MNLQLPEGAKKRIGKGEIYQMQFSPDDTVLAVATSIGILIYDVDTHQEIALLTEHNDVVKSLAFSPDGQTLASGGGWKDKSTRLWDVQTRQLQKTLTGHDGEVTCLAFHPNGESFASGSSDKTICLWNIDRGDIDKTERKTRIACADRVVDIAFSSDGKMLASGEKNQFDQSIHLRDAETGQGVETLISNVESMRETSVAFSPDGTTLAGSCNDTIHLWDIPTGEPRKTFTNPGRVVSIAFNPSSTLLASAGTQINLWDVATAEHKQTLWGSHDYVYPTHTLRTGIKRMHRRRGFGNSTLCSGIRKP
ncbi:WD40 repeat domain-containing protein [Candidatus Poribacteria bacterium]|nr:WD40 repeat domain-containing protein [Candidatus Poribacteria bacterium]